MENVTIKDIPMRKAAFEFCGSNPNWKDKTLILGSKCIEQVGLPRKRWGAEFRVLCYDIMSGGTRQRNMDGAELQVTRESPYYCKISSDGYQN